MESSLIVCGVVSRFAGAGAGAGVGAGAGAGANKASKAAARSSLVCL